MQINNTYPGALPAAAQNSGVQTPTSSTAFAVSSGGEEAETEQEIGQIPEADTSEQFLAEVEEAGSMAAYLWRLNQEKIEKMIEEEKARLEEAYGLNRQPPLEGEARSL